MADERKGTERNFDQLLGQMAAIATAVNAFTSEAVQQAAFEALLRSFMGEHPVGEPVKLQRQKEQQGGSRKGASNGETGESKAARKKRVGTPSLVKDLVLRPKDKQPFADFAAEKAPATNHERNLVCVYWLAKVAEVKNINVDHVYTCYKDVKTWRVPADLYNSLQVTASTQGWINTEDMQNIRVAVNGENVVEQDLPRKLAKAK